MIGKALKYMRTRKSFKQEQIAKIIDVARNTVSQYENDAIQPTFDTIEKIANNCGYKIYFISEDDKFQIKDLKRRDI